MKPHMSRARTQFQLHHDSTMLSLAGLFPGRLYAMERGLRIPQKERTKTTNALLISLMNQLEKDKKSIQLGPEDSMYVEGFASNVFAKADKQDRAGRADLNTAKTFYAASIFFEILNQFGELQPELEQRQKYAAWKAADIRKALKEGRKPEPGPPGGDKDLSVPSSSMSGPYDLGPSETLPANHPGAVDNSSTLSHDKVNYQPPTNAPTSPPSYPTSDYPSDDFYPPPSPAHRPENSDPPQPYHHRPHPHEPQQPAPQNYPSHETPSSSFSYPNFQTYPSFSDHSLPSVPTHYPSYYQGFEGSYTHQSSPPPVSHQSPPPPLSHQSPPPPLSHQSPPPPVSHHPSTAEYTSGSRNTESIPTSSQTFHYDSNYQPAPDKIAEAHKAARFAVGALAFDDVSVAVDFLRKSLELLTNPSATQ
ncbi:hypothetical protein BVC80_1755g9 [Macleaya cordata]|uniref:Uncharacterized protein n=1 Tax=Macleaya cordata TaxID=56857 RepID=A0A200QI10_MACCD|nr:hypothetical protein BVC80_1755g9 [Macleaya cordata]